MKNLLIAAAGFGLLAGCALPPENTTPADLSRWDAAVASIGCDLVDESDYLPVELQTGLPRPTVVAVAQYKVANDEAVQLSNGGVRLVTGPCTPAPEPAAGAGAAA